MKYIEKSIEDEQTGATANYHEVTTLNIDYINGNATVVTASYVSAKTKAAGKNALSFSSFNLSPLPADRNAVGYDWALTQLIQAQPEDFTPETYTGYVNPHTFAGGKIKDTAA
ncbi:hypothetical protein [Testudinibacter sp. TR-2022]|uniref:hypothetical protein n=1 Tax=Testudinibacter sp. TR-2022 TaxID=2585029 RepID=UPI00111B67BF|nr:hypothetical protein [Testudinibacter sp. TR-2022]TNH06614.1 hypothetical protein FHQ30_07145 [Pasteurellaceae bacterium Phil11]TNH25547.1 hypothetical protein FHQ29_01380 [Testudinibacter sp. TR-2022]TNH25673.1 hypothetical protein FHQ27_08715 [Testudinibacter sp. TR-2022]